MRVRRNPNFVAGALLAVAAGLALLGPALAPAKKGKSELRSPGKLVVATQGYTLDKVDDRTRMTVSAPGASTPTAAGSSPVPPRAMTARASTRTPTSASVQHGYHITAA